MVVEKQGSALWRLAKDVQKNLTHFNIRVIDVHPKRPDPEQLDLYNESIQWADIISYEYFKTALMLLENYPNNKPKILAHYNPYNLNDKDWSEFDLVIVPNSEMQGSLKTTEKVPLAINLDFFKFQREMPKSNKILMIANRIEGKKGILPVAEVCKELGYPMILVGAISDREYFDKIMATGVVEFREQISDEELLKSYYESAIHICNSVSMFESGTMPVLEAMATGVPVLTRNIGHVPDLKNNDNMIIRKGEPEDKEDLKKELQKLMEDKEKRRDMRENAWKTVKTRDSIRRAVQYEKMIWQVLRPSNDLVSVIIPTFNRKDILAKTIEGILVQDWPAIEIIVADDGSTDGTKEFVISLNKMIPNKVITPIKYVSTNKTDTYNLAEARNLGIIESSGKILVFLDDRYYAKPNLISEFVKNLREKHWIYGNKGNKKGFVENVSCVYRQEFINAGMFNQSCNRYGFQSQELRSRFLKQGFKFDFIESAKVKTQFDTKNKYTKKDEIRISKNILWRLGLE